MKNIHSFLYRDAIYDIPNKTWVWNVAEGIQKASSGMYPEDSVRTEKNNRNNFNGSFTFLNVE